LVVASVSANEKVCKQDSPPIIDIGALYDSEWTLSKQNVVDEIGEACKRWGFFQVVNHSINLGLLEDTRKVMEEFFALSTTEKNQVKRTQNNSRGFADDELTKQKRDWKEIFDFGSAREDEPPQSIMDGYNQWPGKPEQFRKTMQQYFQANTELAKVLMDAIAWSLKVDPRHFREVFAEHTSFARLNYYPQLPSDANKSQTLGISRHTDAGGLTVLWQDGPGLQVYSGSKEDKHDGEWVGVNPPSLEAFTINIGDMMHVWTGGVYTAPEHRVIANHDKKRYSIPFFYNPSYAVVMEPIPNLQGSSQKYRPFTWGEFRSKRFAGDYADVGKETQIEDWEILEP